MAFRINVLTCSNSLRVWSWRGGELSVSSLQKSEDRRAGDKTTAMRLIIISMYILIRAAEHTCHVTYGLGWPLLFHRTVPKNKEHSILRKKHSRWQMWSNMKKHLQWQHVNVFTIITVNASCRTAVSKRHLKLFPNGILLPFAPLLDIKCGGWGWEDGFGGQGPLSQTCCLQPPQALTKKQLFSLSP